MVICGSDLHLCDGDADQGIIKGAKFGRDYDTVATVAGSTFED